MQAQILTEHVVSWGALWLGEIGCSMPSKLWQSVVSTLGSGSDRWHTEHLSCLSWCSAVVMGSPEKLQMAAFSNAGQPACAVPPAGNITVQGVQHVAWQLYHISRVLQ
jgi:hypothetical protein